jgi:hypothetical protein
MPIDWNGWVEVFRTGDYGAKGSYTEADLDRIAASYDPTVHQAPLTIGHPEHDKPAYGWVSALKREGSKLLARFSQVHGEFKDRIERGLYKTRSVSLYRALGGGLYLRHVGFLGAMPPEVKGLSALPAFVEREAERIEFNFQDKRGGFMDLFRKSSDVVTNADLKHFEEGLGDKIDRMIRERLGNRMNELAEQLGEKLASLIDGSIAVKLLDVKQQLQRKISAQVSQTVNEIVSENPKFGEGSSRRYRSVHYTEGTLPAEGLDLAEQAEELARERGIPYGEALTLVKEERRRREFEESGPPKAYEVCGVTIVEDPRNPFDPASLERANRAQAVSTARGVSFAEALSLVREAEWVVQERNLSFAEALEMV